MFKKIIQMGDRKLHNFDNGHRKEKSMAEVSVETVEMGKVLSCSISFWKLGSWKTGIFCRVSLGWLVEMLC
jgi:hypothetical protein